MPASTSRSSSSPPADGQSPLPHAPKSRDTKSRDTPYWGILQSPSASWRNSREARPTEPCTDQDSPVLAKDKPLPSIEALECHPETSDPQDPELKTQRRAKRFGLADPVAWDVINRSLMQQQRLSDLVVTNGQVIVPMRQSSKKMVSPVSRTSSQRRALNRFEKELGKFADAADIAGKAPVFTPTISESKESMHTVKPLVPYKDEFLAAGLAVTSAEQSRNFPNKGNGQPSRQGKRPRKHSNELPQGRERLERYAEGTPRKSTSTSCTSSGSHGEFSPPDGQLPHDIAPLIPRRPKRKPNQGQPRKHLFSWFLNKPLPPIKDDGIPKQAFPVRIQHVKGKQIDPGNSSSARHGHSQLQHASHKPTMQSTPETFLPKPAPPTKYVTSKKEPCVALTVAQFEKRAHGFHPMQDFGSHRRADDARTSMGGVWPQGRRDMTRGLPPKACPDPIETIEEVTETAVFPFDINNNDRCLPPTRHNEMPKVTVGPYHPPISGSTSTHESSVRSLPFASGSAGCTSSSLQRALDDACQKIDEESRPVDNLLEQKVMNQTLPPIPQRDSRRHRVPRHGPPQKLPPTGRCTDVEVSIPKPQTLSSTSKPLPPEPVSPSRATQGQCSDAKPPTPTRQTPAVPRALTGKRKNPVAELAKAEEMLKDLDVFLNDYDDADIKDRDVIKGLQVATHAAADDLFDAYIRHKTGLRIRRFLADLKSFDETNEVVSTGQQQQARDRRSESRRLRRIRDGNDRR